MSLQSKPAESRKLFLKKDLFKKPALSFSMQVFFMPLHFCCVFLEKIKNETPTLLSYTFIFC